MIETICDPGAIMRKGSRRHYIAWLAPSAFAISWEIDKTAVGSRLRFPIRRRSVTDRKAAEGFAAKWGPCGPQSEPLSAG